MRQGIRRLAVLATVSIAAAANAQTIANGDFEQSPPRQPGWREVGNVFVGPAGSQGTPNSANVGQTPGIPLQGGAWVGSGLWQTFTTPAVSWPVEILFDYRAVPGTCVWVEVDGPAGVHGAWLPSAPLFSSVWVQYPAAGALTISFNILETPPASGGPMQGLFQVDNVSSEVGDVPVGSQVMLQSNWLPSNPATSKELALVELYNLRTALGLTLTSPKGYEGIEGDGMHGHILLSKPVVTWQQVDSTLRGPGNPNLRAVSFRRDLNTATNAAFVARQVTLAVVLAHSDVQNLSTTHAQNYKDQPVTVFASKVVNAPDWSNQPTGSNPAPFNLRVPFDTRWNYNGTDDLLWELQITSNSLPSGAPFVNYPFDLQSAPGSFNPTSANATVNGGGCTTAGQSAPFTLQSTFYNHKSKFRITTTITTAPPSTSLVLLISGTDPNISLPILCMPLRANPDLVTTLGTTDPNGALTTGTLDNIPYLATLIGQTLYAQSTGLDRTQPQLPYSLSNGVKLVVPSDPQFPPFGRVYSWKDSATGSWSVAGPFASGVVALFDY